MFLHPRLYLAGAFLLALCGAPPAYAGQPLDKTDKKAANGSDAGPDAKLKALIKDLEIGSTAEKVAAAGKLGELGQDARPADKALCRSLVYGAPDVVQASGEALEKIYPELEKPVITLLKDKNPGNQTQALMDLGKMGSDAAAAAVVVESYIKHCLARRGNRAAAPQAILTLGQMAPADRASVQTLTSYTREVDSRGAPDVAVRRAAVEALGKVAAAHDELVKEIVPTLMRSTEATYARGLPPGAITQVRVAAMQALGSLGSDAKAAVTQLRRLKFDSDAAIRQAATDALAKIGE